MSEPCVVNVLEEKWDFLIILDACRYDYFENQYTKYFDGIGQLHLRRSPGSCTDEWRDKSFPGFYEDIVYISANPQISATTPVFGYLASEHFKYIHELWKDNWDDDNGTVLPDVVSKSVLEIIPRYPQKMRYVIHYLQPHAPYLNISYDRKSNTLKEFERFLINPNKEYGNITFKLKVFKCLLPLFRKNQLLTNQPAWILRKVLGIPPKGPMETAWRYLGVNGLRGAYRKNLDCVLKNASELVNQISGRIVITSDHGDYLGENRRFSHPGNSEDSILRNVPWLVIEKERKVAEYSSKAAVSGDFPEKPTVTDSGQSPAVVERLRDLGYYL